MTTVSMLTTWVYSIYTSLIIDFPIGGASRVDVCIFEPFLQDWQFFCTRCYFSAQGVIFLYTEVLRLYNTQRYFCYFGKMKYNILFLVIHGYG